MNELDYVRDNRLRLWFIDRCLPHGLELKARNRETAYVELMRSVCGRLASGIVPGGYFALVVGDATRGGAKTGRTANLTKRLFETDNSFALFEYEGSYLDKIPDIRRSRRECNGTKIETILIYRKK